MISSGGRCLARQRKRKACRWLKKKEAESLLRDVVLELSERTPHAFGSHRLKQAATLQWWQEVAPKCEIYISQYVNTEARGGDSERAALRGESMRGVSAIDASVPDVTELANLLMRGHAVPDCESPDVIHIAAAAVYGMDVLLTLNCKHMDNPVT